jgi:transcriptional regulator with XRE-family HTH domain
MSFAERLGVAREHAGLTMVQVAERVGVHWISYSRWERGVTEPHIPRATEKLADALGVSMVWLSSGDGRMRIRKRKAS